MSASSDVAGGASLAANMMLKEKDYQSVHDRERSVVATRFHCSVHIIID